MILTIILKLCKLLSLRSEVPSVNFFLITGNIVLLLVVLVAIDDGTTSGRGSCSIGVDELLTVKIVRHLHLVKLV